MSNLIRNLQIKYGVDISQYTTAINKMKSEQTALESKFRDTANAMDNWQSTSQGLAVRVSTLNDKIKLQRQIVDQLKQEYTAVSTATGQESAASQKLEKQYIQASGALDKMNRELNGYQEELYQAAVAEGKTAAEAQQMGGKIKTASSDTNSFKSQIKDFASSSIGQFASVTGAVMLLQQGFRKLWDTINEAADFADELITLSNQTGIAAEELQRWGYAARFVDTEVTTITDSLKKLTRSIYEASTGSKEQQEIFKELGVTYQDANGNLLDNEAVFFQLIDALGAMTDETKRDAFAMKLMGKSAQDLNPLIKAGSAALIGYGDEAKDTGIVIDRISVAALQRLDDQLERTSATMQAEGRKMAASMAPVTGALSNLWETAVRSFNGQIDYFTRAEKVIQSWGGTSKQKVTEYIDGLRNMQGALYASGLSEEEFNRQLEMLTVFLASQGTPTALQHAEALNLLAEGYTAASYKAKLEADKQAEYVQAQADQTAELQKAYDDRLKTFQDYTDKVLDGAENHKDAMGDIYDKEIEMSKISVDEVIKNLTKQTQQFNKWQSDLAVVAKRVPPSVLDELRKLGPGAAPLISELATTSYSKLNEVVAAFQNKSGAAREAMVTELRGSIGGTQTTINDVAGVFRGDTSVEGNAGVTGIRGANALAKGILTGKGTVANAAEDVGKALSEGMADGIYARKSSVINAAINVAEAAIRSARAKLGVNSPSKVAMHELGEPIGEGFELGMRNSMQDAFGSMKSELSSGISSLSRVASPQTVSERISNNTVNNTTINKQAIVIPLTLNGREVARAIVDDVSAYQGAAAVSKARVI